MLDPPWEAGKLVVTLLILMMLPLVSTWNLSPSPTVRSEAGLVSPMPTLPSLFISILMLAALPPLVSKIMLAALLFLNTNEFPSGAAKPLLVIPISPEAWSDTKWINPLALPEPPALVSIVMATSLGLAGVWTMCRYDVGLFVPIPRFPAT